MIQKTPKKKTKTIKKTTTETKSKTFEATTPEIVSMVVEKEKMVPKKSALKKVLTGILFVATLVIWFFVGQNIFSFVTENLWLSNKTNRVETNKEVVATINGTPVYMSEVREFAKSIPQLSELPFDMIYPQLLERMINSRVLLESANLAGTAEKKDVQKALQLSHDQIISQAYLMERLEQSVTPEQMKAAYEQEVKNFKPVDEIRASHILVKTEKEAEDILVQLRAGADFGLLADTKSLDKNSVAGDLGYFTEEMMIPEFGKAAFALKKGQISEPVKTAFGWHIILLQDRRLATPPTFDDVQEQIKQILMEQNAKQVLIEEWKKMKVKITKKNI